MSACGEFGRACRGLRGDVDRSVSVPRVWVPVQAAECLVLRNGALTKLQAAFACYIADRQYQLHASEPAAKLLYVLVRSQGCLAYTDVVRAIRGNAFGWVLDEVQPSILSCHNDSQNALVPRPQAFQEVNVEARGLAALLDQALALPSLFLWPANTRLSWQRADEVLARHCLNVGCNQGASFDGADLKESLRDCNDRLWQRLQQNRE